MGELGSELDDISIVLSTQPGATMLLQLTQPYHRAHKQVVAVHLLTDDQWLEVSLVQVDSAIDVWRLAITQNNDAALVLFLKRL